MCMLNEQHGFPFSYFLSAGNTLLFSVVGTKSSFESANFHVWLALVFSSPGSRPFLFRLQRRTFAFVALPKRFAAHARLLRPNSFLPFSFSFSSIEFCDFSL